jgi:hypothetical protein
MIEVRFNGKPADEFVDFFVGLWQAPIKVTIRTDPPGVPLTWTVSPLGAHSGTVDPAEGTSTEFAFSPNVGQARALMRTASSRPNAAVGYRVTVTVDGPVEPEVCVADVFQDERAVMRQEYVDFNVTPPSRDVLHEHQGLFNSGSYHYVVDLPRLQRKFNAVVAGFRGRQVEVDGQPYTIARNAGLVVAGAYRNPRRAGGLKPADAKAAWGRALALALVTPVKALAGADPHAIEAGEAVYAALREAAGSQGRAVLGGRAGPTGPLDGGRSVAYLEW